MLSSVAARAQSPGVDHEAGPESNTTPTFECTAGPWKLDGAQWKSGAQVAYIDTWSPTLENIASCAGQVLHSGSCIEVQGHFDDIPFDSSVVRVFGSKEAAQQARGRGRATSILQRLADLGVPRTMLREVAPGATATFRGAEVRIAGACSADIEALDNRYRDIVAAQFVELERERDIAQQAAAVEAPSHEPHQPKVTSSRHRFWLGGGLDASALFLFQDTDDVFAPVLRLGGGWHGEHIYGHLAVGGSLGTQIEERIGVELEAAMGYYRDAWIQVGLAVGYRIASSSGNTPWVDKAWHVAIEAHQCPWQWGKLEVCAREALAPIGGHARRAQYNDALDTFEIMDTQRRNVIRFDLGAVARFQL